MSRNRHRGRTHGRILEVTEETLGSVLAADAAAGATVLYVDDAADFEDDGSGGWLSINDQMVAYSDVDDDTGQITLTTGLTAAADEGDSVSVWSNLYDEAATLKTALVMVDGWDDNTDPIVATLADAVQDLSEGLRGEAGENCTLHQISADEWEVTAVGGRPSSTKGANAGRFEDADTFTATAGGDQAFALSHKPIPGSVHLSIGGVPQTHTEFSVDYDTGIVAIPDTYGLFESGDWFDFRYAYTVSVRTPYTIDWASPGWKYTNVASSDTTDRSGQNFNDGGWSVAAAPFGDSVGQPFNYIPGLDWPAPATSFPKGTATWLRRTITDAPKQQLTITTRADNYADVYWNGTKIGTTDSGGGINEYTFSVPAASVQASNVLAVRAWDTGSSSDSKNHTYLDVQVTI